VLNLALLRKLFAPFVSQAGYGPGSSSDQCWRLVINIDRGFQSSFLIFPVTGDENESLQLGPLIRGGYNKSQVGAFVVSESFCLFAIVYFQNFSSKLSLCRYIN